MRLVDSGQFYRIIIRKFSPTAAAFLAVYLRQGVSQRIAATTKLAELGGSLDDSLQTIEILGFLRFSALRF